MTSKKLRIGTRGSRLAIHQTEKVASALKSAHPDIACEIVPIKTSGDWTPAQGDTPLAARGGDKGLFAKEIEKSLLDGHIDLAAHSVKDLPTHLPEGLILTAYVPREDARDALVTRSGAGCLMDLPADSVIGTSSVRRAAMIKIRRPDLRVVPIRGNLDTRLEKLSRGQVEALILAKSGLDRLNYSHLISETLAPELMLPGAGQGAIGIEIRADDALMTQICDHINHRETDFCITAERAMLRALDGSCATPIGAFAEYTSPETITLRGLLADPDGGWMEENSQTAKITDLRGAFELGRSTGLAIRRNIPDHIEFELGLAAGP